MIIDKKILITGDRGLGAALADALPHNEITMISRKATFDINNIDSWISHFKDYDIVINNAYDGWAQITVLERFFDLWKNFENRMIVSIGSMVTDYQRSERDKDAHYWPYRLHKQALQAAFQRMCQEARCDIKLINPGPIDTKMSEYIMCDKICPHWLSEKIVWVMTHPEIKRIDLWK